MGNREWIPESYPQTSPMWARASRSCRSATNLLGQTKIDSTLVIGFRGGVDVQPGERKLGRALLAEDPERAADHGVILHLLRVLVAEDQQGGRGFDLYRRLRRSGRRGFPLLAQARHFIFQAIYILLLLRQ